MPARDNKGKILTGELLEGRYRITRPLGEGGQGAVYEASHVRLSGKRVAIKEMFGNDELFTRAFEREAALLANLDHPALPDVSDYFQEDGSCFLVMEFIEGKNLWELMGITDDTGKGTPLDIESVLRWADDLLDALDYIHTQSQPVIHKDIKAQNIAVTSRNKVMLLDFGLATGAVGEITAVKSTLLRGYSAYYAPPEQILRSRVGHWYEVAKAMLDPDEVERIASQGTDARSDLYSLAATLYHCLTGEPPAVSTIRLMAASQGRPDPLKPASEINEQVNREIASVLMQAMRLNRDSRFASAKAMRKALSEVTDSRIQKDEKPAEPARLPAPPPDIYRTVKADEDPKTLPLQSPQPVEVKADVPLITAPEPPGAKVTSSDSKGSRWSARKVWLVVAGVLAIAAIAIVVIWALNSGGSGPITSAPEPIDSQPPAPPEMREALSYYLELADDRGGNVVNKRRSAGSESATAYDYFRFKFTPKESGYLYIIGPGTDGGEEIYLTDRPSEVSGVSTNRVEAGREFQFPGGEDGWIQIERNNLIYRVIFSTDKSRAPDFLKSSSGRRLTEAEQKEIESLAQKSKIETGSESSVIKVPVSSPEAGRPLIFDITISRR